MQIPFTNEEQADFNQAASESGQLHPDFVYSLVTALRAIHHEQGEGGGGGRG